MDLIQNRAWNCIQIKNRKKKPDNIKIFEKNNYLKMIFVPVIRYEKRRQPTATQINFLKRSVVKASRDLFQVKGKESVFQE